MTIQEFLEENQIKARLVMSRNYEDGNVKEKDLEVFLDEDMKVTLDESKACAYEAQSMERLIELGETLANVIKNIHAVFYAPDGGNIEGWLGAEELDEEITEDHFLMELV